MSINSSQEKVDSYLVLEETGIRMVRTSMLEFGDWHTIRFDSRVAQRTRPLFPPSLFEKQLLNEYLALKRVGEEKKKMQVTVCAASTGWA